MYKQLHTAYTPPSPRSHTALRDPPNLDRHRTHFLRAYASGSRPGAGMRETNTDLRYTRQPSSACTATLRQHEQKLRHL